MRRVRIVLAALVLALAVPVTLIVSRALDAIEFERRARHGAVADRVFDEMERTLSDFLAREEARPPDDYAFYSRLDESAPLAASRVRSPLSRPAEEPFVLAHFQIDPDGRLVTPLRPDDEDRARGFGDWPPPTAERARVELGLGQLEARVVPFWKTAIAHRIPPSAVDERVAGGLETEADLEETDQLDSLAKSMVPHDKPAGAPIRPGRTTPAAAPPGKNEKPSEWKDGFDDAEMRESSDTRADMKKKARAEHDPVEEKVQRDETTAYDVFDSLNRAALQRQSRKQRVTEVEPSRTFAKRDVAEKPAPSGEGGAIPQARLSDESGSGLAVGSVASEESYRANERQEIAQRFDADARLEQEPKQAPVAEPTLRVILHPMAGAALGDDLLMLYRTVSVDGAGYRQGVLLDRESLGHHLEREVISALPIADALWLQFNAGSAATALEDWYYAEHRFAEPFDGLDVRLALAPLAGTAGAAPLYALAALLVIVALVGVLAVHRMVGVVVDFAERRSNFVASVSHELKTPLTSIRMYAEMLRDGLIGESTRREEYYRTIHDESERLSRLIDNVLEFSRLEKGSRVFNLSVGALDEIVDEIAERLRPHAKREGFTLRVEVDSDLPPVRFDRDALVQIVFNLVDNAIKYAGDCERREIVLRCARSEGGGAVISVRDFGPGVSRQHLAQVFEPFYRAEPELTRAARGSGIGLALVKELGEAMGAVVTGANPADGGFRVDVAFETGVATA